MNVRSLAIDKSVHGVKSAKSSRRQLTGLQGGPKLAHFLRLMNSSNADQSDQFSNFFHCHNQEKIVNSSLLSLNIQKHTSSVSLHYLVKCVLKATRENKPTFVTTHFKNASSSSKADTLSVLCKNYRSDSYSKQ